jgi:hypothetical protein
MRLVGLTYQVNQSYNSENVGFDPSVGILRNVSPFAHVV